MAKDYAKSYGKRKKQYKSSSNSGAAWLVVGLLIGLGIGGFLYINQNGTSAFKNLKIAPAHVVIHKEKTQVTHNKSAATPKEETKQPQFDFYTILPNMNGNDDAKTQVAQQQAPAAATPTTVAAVKPAPPAAATPVKIVSAASEADATIENKTDTKPTHKVATAQPAEKNITDADADTATEAKKSAHKQELMKKAMHKELAEENSEVVKKQTSSKTTDETSSESHPKKEATKSSRYVLQIASFKSFEEADQLKAKLTMLGFDVKMKSGAKGHRVYLGIFNNSQQASQVQQQLKEQQINSTMVKLGESMG